MFGLLERTESRYLVGKEPAVASLDEVDVVVAVVVLESTVSKTVRCSDAIEHGRAWAYWWDGYVVYVSKEWLLDGHVLSFCVGAEQRGHWNGCPGQSVSGILYVDRAYSTTVVDLRPDVNLVAGGRGEWAGPRSTNSWRCCVSSSYQCCARGGDLCALVAVC